MTEVGEMPRGNIGDNGVRKRLMIGVPLLVIGVAASFLSRSFLGQVVVFFGFLSIYQALDRTCVALAARGGRSVDGQLITLQNTEMVEHFQKRARRIYFKTFFSTLGVLLAGRAWLHWYG